jgi:hypothetical protein
MISRNITKKKKLTQRRKDAKENTQGTSSIQQLCVPPLRHQRLCVKLLYLLNTCAVWTVAT